MSNVENAFSSIIISLRFAYVRFTSFRFDPLRFDPLRFTPLRSDPLRSDSLRFDSLRFDPLRFDPLRFDPLRFDPLRFKSVKSHLIHFFVFLNFFKSDFLYANTSPDKKKHDKIKLRNIIRTDLFCFIKTSPFIQNRLARLYSSNPIYNTNRFVLQELGRLWRVV